MKLKKIVNSTKFTLPNILTLSRIVFIIPFIFSMLSENYVRSGFVLLLSGLTDFLDGYLARKFNQQSDFGKMLDPIADKLTLMAVMVCVSIKFTNVMPFMVIMIAKESLMLIAGAVLLKFNKQPTGARWYGKLSTMIFYISIITLISLKAIYNFQNISLTLVLMSITSAFMIFALMKYFKLFIKLIKN